VASARWRDRKMVLLDRRRYAQRRPDPSAALNEGHSQMPQLSTRCNDTPTPKPGPTPTLSVPPPRIPPCIVTKLNEIRDTLQAGSTVLVIA